MGTYGFQVKPSLYHPRRDCLADVARTGSGNFRVRVGREHGSGGWQQTGYAVLTADEARELAAELLGKAPLLTNSPNQPDPTDPANQPDPTDPHNAYPDYEDEL